MAARHSRHFPVIPRTFRRSMRKYSWVAGRTRLHSGQICTSGACAITRRFPRRSPPRSRLKRTTPSPYFTPGRCIGELLAGDGAHLAVALGQVLPPTGDLGGVDHAGLELVEVRQGNGHGNRGRQGMAGLPSKGHEEPGPRRGAGEEGEGEENAFGSRHRSSSFLGVWMPAESEIGPGPLPTP